MMSELSDSVAGHVKPATAPADPGNTVDQERASAARRRRGRSSGSIARMREKLGDDI